MIHSQEEKKRTLKPLPAWNALPTTKATRVDAARAKKYLPPRWMDELSAQGSSSWDTRHCASKDMTLLKNQRSLRKMKKRRHIQNDLRSQYISQSQELAVLGAQGVNKSWKQFVTL
jgi:hypothetical protein